MPQTRYSRLLIFDSGLGGLTVLRTLRAAIPEAALFYLADDACFPYSALGDAELADRICEALAPGGLLLYETFTIRQRDLGQQPTNPAFLLQEGELQRAFGGLETLPVGEDLTEGPRPDAMARLVARRSARSLTQDS